MFYVAGIYNDIPERYIGVSKISKFGIIRALNFSELSNNFFPFINFNRVIISVKPEKI